MREMLRKVQKESTAQSRHYYLLSSVDGKPCVYIGVHTDTFCDKCVFEKV